MLYTWRWGLIRNAVAMQVAQAIVHLGVTVRTEMIGPPSEEEMEGIGSTEEEIEEEGMMEMGVEVGGTEGADGRPKNSENQTQVGGGGGWLY